jgi:hypothetical protein
MHYQAVNFKYWILMGVAKNHRGCGRHRPRKLLADQNGFVYIMR